MEDDAILALCTAPDAETAAKLARTLVAERLAACVNVVPGLRSFYEWEGEVQDDAEVQLLIKTRASRTAELEARLKELHPYDVPEILFLTVRGGSAEYLAWLHETTRPRDTG